MKLFKCYNCLSDKEKPGRDFTAAEPKCPHCGLDGTDPHVKHLIVQRRIVHFEPPHPIAKDRGTGKLACGANRAGTQSTGVITVANCPACKESEAGKLAAKPVGVDEFELELNVDLANQQFTTKE